MAGKTALGGTQPGTLVPPSDTPSATWTTDEVDTFDFYVLRGGDADYYKSNVAGPYSLVVTGPPPVISGQPQSLHVYAGQPATFNVTVSGGGTFTYRWRHNGVDLAGANSASLTLPAAQPADAGAYAVVVTNSAGSYASNSANLTVTVAPPAIVLPPVNQTVAAGQSVMFVTAAAGSLPLAYQWFKDGSTLAGATDAILTLASVQPAHAGAYFLRVSNAAGSITSATVSLTVTLAGPAILSHPVSQQASLGQYVSFSVAASGSAPLSFQWRKNGVAIPGATSSTFILSSAQIPDSANAPGYSVVVSNSVGSVTSNAATLAVSATPAIRLALQYWQPGDWPDRETGTGDFFDQWVLVEAHEEEYGHDEDTDGDGNPDTWVVDGTRWVDEYWELQSVFVPDVALDGWYGSRWDTTVGTFGQPTANDTGAFNPAVLNRGYLLHSYPPNSDDIVLRLWAYAPAGNCSSFRFAIFAPSGVLTHHNGDIPAGSFSEVWLTPWEWGPGSYRVDLSFSGATATTPASGTVSYYFAVGAPLPPTIVVHPGPPSQMVNAGATVTYTVTATGATRYQWEKDGTPLPGATNPGLTLPSATAAAAGTYRVVVGNATGSTTSHAVLLQVNDDPWADPDRDGLPSGIEQLLGTAPAQAGTIDSTNATFQLKIHHP